MRPPKTQRKESYEARHPLPKPIALSQELQTKSLDSKSTHEAWPVVSARARWSPTQDRMNANHRTHNSAAIGAGLKMQLTEPRHWQEDHYTIDIRRHRPDGFLSCTCQRARVRHSTRASRRRASKTRFSAGPRLAQVAEAISTGLKKVRRRRHTGLWTTQSQAQHWKEQIYGNTR